MTKRKKSTDQRLLESYEAGDFVSAAPTKAELKKFRDAARVTLVKDRRVNIRLSSPVLLDIQARAAERGGIAISDTDRQRTAQVRGRTPRRAAIAPNHAFKRARRQVARRLTRALGRTTCGHTSSNPMEEIMTTRATAVLVTLAAFTSSGVLAADTPGVACSLLISSEIDAATGAKTGAGTPSEMSVPTGQGKQETMYACWWPIAAQTRLRSPSA